MTRLRFWLLAALAGVAGLTACSDTSSGPTIDCNHTLGAIFVELEPAPTGTFIDYQINVGDSIQLHATLRRVDASTAQFNLLQGWYCVTTGSSPVSGVVGFSTTDTELVRLSPGGWIRGLRPGTAIVRVASTEPPAFIDISILVYSP